ncbi:MAG: serine hydrolase [Acidimicrobiia bacterium]
MIRRSALLLVVALVVDGCAPETRPSETSPTTTPATVTSVAATTSTTVLPRTAIGMSREGRSIETMSFGNGSRRLYVLGGIHGDERPAVENVPALIDHLAGDALEGWTVRIVLDANPDGTIANTRENAAGVDLNRNWPTEGFAPSAATGPAPLSEPETDALAKDIAAFAPDLIVALHAAREGPFVEHDGAAAEAPAAAFAAGASVLGREWEVVAEVDWVTEGSLGTYFGKEGRIPVVTVEFNRWDSPAGVTAELLAGMTGLLDKQPARAMPTCAGHRAGMTCGPPAEAAHELLHGGTTGGAHGFIIKEVGGPVHAALHADARFYPASTIKLIHFVHALRWVAQGNDAATPVTIFGDGCDPGAATGEERLDELLHSMMFESDNAAANALQSHFGLDDLRATMSAAGMTATRLVHGFGCGGPANDPANATTAVDLARLLEGLVDGTLVPGPAGFEDLMVDASGSAGLDQSSGIQLLVKEGWYGTTLTVAGIAIVPGAAGSRTLVFAAYTDGAATVDPSFSIVSVAASLVSSVVAP